ncbi:small CPxCG-related zinc finger protein [Natronomonas pharaonis DSM 2160]|uniref:Small CPxCG-related zinc finger protein n=1 Tax=Natronomonas pharaonis (strain ATCC 35678 / DSM 2160 / CIP 103997 / JCM 8858 / NBRC 14720 / NCIMB 2260 / Gabara) TaxID=348780 RepID=A0A1U7EX11_NATPD|nr:zinc ribbon domain-containing protein [Natronomonas pharaonis]CAI49633.1 small CPxCG-related zinc finger protein [Natronomonas pharaonis DSM 2160]
MQQCSNCGESVDADDTFCPNCGAQFQSAAPDSSLQSSSVETSPDADAAGASSDDWTLTHYAGIALSLAAAGGIVALATMDVFQRFDPGAVEWLFLLLWFGAASGIVLRDSRGIGLAAVIFAAGGVVSGLGFVQRLLWEVAPELATELFNTTVPAPDPVMGIHNLLLGVLWSPTGGGSTVSTVLLDIEIATHLFGVLVCFIVATVLWRNRSALATSAP